MSLQSTKESVVGAKPLQVLNTKNTSLSRSNSRTKGINFNTVSPISSKITTPRKSSCLSNSDQSNRINDSLRLAAEKIEPGSGPLLSSHDLKPESTNISSKQLSKLTIDEQLRLLALKEMSLVELKDTIADLNAKLRLSEKELQRFRQTIQRNLYREMQISSVDHLIQKRDLPVSNVEKTPSNSSSARSRSRPSVRRASRTDCENDSKTKIKATEPVHLKEPIRSPKMHAESDASSLWSKPIAFIQNLDSMIQNEVDKAPLKHPDFRNSPKHLSHRTQYPSNGEHVRREPGALASLYANSGSLESFKETLAETIPFKDPEVMLQTVSNSLWSFMNEVKQNVLAPSMSPELTIKSDFDALLDFASDEEDIVDLSIYSKMRQPRCSSRSLLQ